MKWVEQVEQGVHENKMGLQALDVGSGSGRDCVFLAIRGWKVVGMEMFDKAVGRMMKLARAYGVSDHVSGAIAEVKNSRVIGDTSFIKSRSYSLVLAVRFLQKAFLPSMADMVAPGGFIVYETFADEGADAGVEGTPRPARLLSPSDLQSAFPPDQFSVINSSLETVPSDGRILRSFVARRIK